jgi:hypothetical protein
MFGIGTYAALLFAASREGADVPAQVNTCLQTLCYRNTFRSAMQDATTAPLLRKLLGGWIGRADRGDPSQCYNKVLVAMQYDVPEALDLSLAILRDVKEVKDGRQPYMLLYAIMAVARFGKAPEHVAALEGLLAHEGVCHTYHQGDRVFQTQVRDAALVALLKLRGQSPSDYGFTRLAPHATMVYVMSSIGFEKDDAQERQQAIDKYRRWAAEQKKK